MQHPTLTREQATAAIERLPGERVTEEYMNSRIRDVSYHRISETVMLCSITLDNSYSVRGEAACIDPVNFDVAIGQRLAYDDAFRKLWPLFGLMLAEARFQRSRQQIEAAHVS